MSGKILAEAEFGNGYKKYLFVEFMGFFAATVVGVVFIPFWLLGWGIWYVNKSQKVLKCQLFEQSVRIKKGVFFKKEKTIPLDRITDVTLIQGPLQRFIGVHRLFIETAGQNQSSMHSEASLIGIIDVESFREQILNQRDTIIQNKAIVKEDASLNDVCDILEKICTVIKEKD